MSRPGSGPLLARLHPRPDETAISHNRTLLAMGRDGFVTDDLHHGLYVHQTRLLSRWRWTIGSQPPQVSALTPVEQHSWIGYYISSPTREPAAVTNLGQGAPGPAQTTLELRLSRSVSDGMHEDADLTNYARKPVRITLALECAADFADQEAPRSPAPCAENLTRDWQQTGQTTWELSWDYSASHDYDVPGERGVSRLRRGARLRIVCRGPAPVYRPEENQILFDVALAPREHWHVCLSLIPRLNDRDLEPVLGCYAFAAGRYHKPRTRFLETATTFEVPGQDSLGPAVMAAAEQARRDLVGMRLYDYDHDGRGWLMAAGLPIYVALFGRDVLTTGWQAALAGPEMMQGALLELAQWQGRSDNPWRDEQPGRHLHEAYTRPLAALNLNPLSRYYGSITTSAFYPVVLSELWHWTGDQALMARLVPAALDGLKWLDTVCRSDQDGFYRYRTRSPQGVRHQAWKDSEDALVGEDGGDVDAPVATCEEQAFVYTAKFQMSEVLWRLGRRQEARQLYRESRELKARFNDAFWMDSESYFAVGLDAQGRQVRAITSNPGHCIAAGIVAKERVAATAGRLLADDLFSGWGIRTLSDRNPGYNPYAYHRGTVWPVEQASFALGFYRYGLHAHAAQLARSQFEAAALFDHHRLPECYSGHSRDHEHPVPALYPNTNWPQAWSSSAIFCLLQALLGIYPYAPLKLLLVDPHLPPWLPEITLRNLRVGRAAADIRFFRRQDGGSSYRVLEKRGRLHVLRQPSPWSLSAGPLERTQDALASVLPGK